MQQQPLGRGLSHAAPCTVRSFLEPPRCLLHPVFDPRGLLVCTVLPGDPFPKPPLGWPHPHPQSPNGGRAEMLPNVLFR